MNTLVTGVAGFIGSHLAEALLGAGHRVTGVDAFTDYYPRRFKEGNLGGLSGRPGFTLETGDLLTLDLPQLLEGVDWVFHHAAQAGVRASWGSTFDTYIRDNVLATQRLLEAAKDAPIQKFVYASSSSIYGDAERYPTPEETLPRPVSPYGVTKLAAEHLCHLYWRNYGVPAVSLRYFTVYGPRQRPDMAFHLFGRALLSGQPIAVYGDGQQTRDFTFISDAIAANLAAAQQGPPGEAYNIGGGSRVSLMEVIRTLEQETGCMADLQFKPVQRGDARHTGAAIDKARTDLGYVPRVTLTEGLAAEVAWLRALVTSERQASEKAVDSEKQPLL